MTAHSGLFIVVKNHIKGIVEVECADCREKFSRYANELSVCRKCGNEEPMPKPPGNVEIIEAAPAPGDGKPPVIDAIDMQMAEKLEMVVHPRHYNVLGAKCHHCGGDIECIDVVEAMSFNVGSAVKYCWRMDEKSNDVEDIKKAIWYLQRELENREKKNSDG